MAIDVQGLNDTLLKSVKTYDEFAKKLRDFMIAPAGDISYEYFDDQGNPQSVSVPNRNKLVQQLLTDALAASSNYFYVDTINGNDLNSGLNQSDSFATVEKAVNSVSYGNLATILVRGDVVLTDKADVTGKRIFLIANNYDTVNQVATQTLTIDQNSDAYFHVSNGIGYLKIVGFDIHSVPNGNAVYHWSMPFKSAYGYFYLQIGEYAKPSNLQIDHPLIHLESGSGVISLYGQTLNTNLTTSTNLVERGIDSYFAYGEAGLIDNTGGIIVRPTPGWN
ncbi:hypothetical protein [Persephonella sp.]